MFGAACTTVTLARLTEAEYRRIENAGVNYSGSTGSGARPEDYNGLAPFIATYPGELGHAISVLGWKKFHLEIRVNDWVVSRKRVQARPR